MFSQWSSSVGARPAIPGECWCGNKWRNGLGGDTSDTVFLWPHIDHTRADDHTESMKEYDLALAGQTVVVQNRAELSVVSAGEVLVAAGIILVCPWGSQPPKTSGDRLSVTCQLAAVEHNSWN